MNSTNLEDEDDELLFVDEDYQDDSYEEEEFVGYWDVLIVDDDHEIHSVTKLALSDLTVFDRRLKFHHCYSGVQAREFMAENDDIAVILLDVVMESDEAGLHVAKAIRDDLNKDEVRIILRTGQPGYAPEESVIKEYDINDYKTKTELTRSKLATAIIAAIRSYQQIKTINQSRRGLEKIITSAANILEHHSIMEFAEGVVIQISSLLGLSPEGVLCAKAGLNIDDSDPDSIYVLGAAGHYANYINRKLENVDNGRIINQISECLKQEIHLFTDTDTVLYLSSGESHAAVYIESGKLLSDVDRQLIEVFLSNIAIGYENVNLFQQLRVAAFRDWLTKLPNRTEFINILDRYVKNEVPGDIIALVDIDHFSDVNDGLGQDTGNLLLLSVAKRLEAELADKCLLARTGADVFGIVGNAEAVNEAGLLALFEKPFKAGDHTIPVNATIGFCRKDKTRKSGLTVMKQAFIALNHAKKSIADKFEYYKPEMEEQTSWRLGMIRQLRTDFADRKLQVWYQPQISLETDKFIAMEALLRWPTEEGGYISPAVFVPLAEYSGLIIDIGDWVLEEACKELNRLDALGLNHMRVAVNVSMHQFRSKGFSARVIKIIQSQNIDMKRIELEITESVVMDEPQLVIDILTELKSYGIAIAIDDFGTGFSSLSYLQQLPLDRIKVDRAFVMDIYKQSGAILAETIINLGQKLGLHTIAEGIEEVAQEDILKKLGCEEGQGFMYAKPMHPDKLEPFLVEKHNA
jgi:diguanylate cyclase (GGDEF)-like protein